jgi:hypothetical protein
MIKKSQKDDEEGKRYIEGEMKTVVRSRFE